MEVIDSFDANLIGGWVDEMYSTQKALNLKEASLNCVGEASPLYGLF